MDFTSGHVKNSPSKGQEISRLRDFENAIAEYATARLEIAEYGGRIGTIDGPLTGQDRHKLSELALAEFEAGERLKAQAMTLVAWGLIDQCCAALQAQPMGQC